MKGENSFAGRLIAGATEAVAIARGAKSPRVTTHMISAREASVVAPRSCNATRIRRIRRKLNVSQAVFADLINASPATVRAWEQGTRAPDGPSLRLLEIADRHPHVLHSLLQGKPADQR